MARVGVPPGVAETCARVADSPRFQRIIVLVIVANAIVIGLGTYDGIDREAGDLLTLLNEIFLGVFTVELVIRIAAYGNHPQRFFRDGWNLFDFVVISLAFVPALRESATLVRMARLLRVVRLASVLPAFRAVLVGMVRSAPAVASMVLLIILVMYVYGMIGWAMFNDKDPEHWGSIGASMLTLFTVLTLEGWNEVLYSGEKIQSGAWIFFVSYVLIVSFMLINIMISFLMSSIEHAREDEEEPQVVPFDERAQIELRLEVVRKALADLEAERARAEAQLPGESIDEEVDARLVALHRAMVDLETELAVQARQQELAQREHLRLFGRGGRPL
jgi:voltage-gated sodium channel